jgi:acetyltransferase-like isoleucine patch superfamily enzyme
LTSPPSRPGKGSADLPAGAWEDGEIPPNCVVGAGTVIRGSRAFQRFGSRRDDAIRIGVNSTLDGVQFALGIDGRLSIGDFCYVTSAVLLAELEISIGSYVVIGWNTTIADSDFHPIAPAQRVLDARALSPLGRELERPPVLRSPVVIEDDVWIGPSATILKGVRIGRGAFIEPGAVVTHDVRPFTHVIGNPARETDR